MDTANSSQPTGQVLEDQLHLNRCMEYLVPPKDTDNATSALLTVEVPVITGSTVVVAACCLAVSVLVLVLRLGAAYVRRHPAPPASSGSLISTLLTPVAAVGATALLLCAQYPIGGTGRQLFIAATFLWTWCRHTFFFLITAANLLHMDTLQQPFNLHPTPPARTLTRLATLTTAFMLLVLGATLSIPSAMRALQTPPCGWAAIIQSYRDFGQSAEVWVIWLDSVAGVVSILSALALMKKAISVHVENSVEADEHKRMLRCLLLEGVSTVVFTATLGLPATLISIYAPLNSTSSRTDFLWLMNLGEILQTVYYAAIAATTFMSYCLARDNHWLCCVGSEGDQGGFPQCCQSPQVEPEPVAEAASTHVITLVAEYVARGTLETEDEVAGPNDRKETDGTMGGDSESLFSVNVNMPQFSVKENLRRKTFFDRPSIISRAANPTPHHGRPSNASITGHSIKSVISSNDNNQSLAARHDSMLSQLSTHQLTNISLYSEASITNQDVALPKSISTSKMTSTLNSFKGASKLTHKYE